MYLNASLGNTSQTAILQTPAANPARGRRVKPSLSLGWRVKPGDTKPTDLFPCLCHNARTTPRGCERPAAAQRPVRGRGRLRTYSSVKLQALHPQWPSLSLYCTNGSFFSPPTTLLLLSSSSLSEIFSLSALL